MTRDEAYAWIVERLAEYDFMAPPQDADEDAWISLIDALEDIDEGLADDVRYFVGL